MGKLEIPRGMRDIEPEVLKTIDYVRGKFVDTANAFGFQLMEPTPIELLSTMELKSGSAIANETYSFSDKGGRKIALRFDLTIGLSRYVVGRRDLKMPLKLASFAGVWRYDEPQAGRYRYFHQWDIEVYGPFNTETDAEVIEFVSQFFGRLGLEIEIHINDRRLVEQFIRRILGEDRDEKISDMLRAIDKVPKKGAEAVLQEYSSRLDVSKLKSLIELSQIKGSADDISAKLPNLADLEQWKVLDGLMDSIRDRGVNSAIVDLGIVRGLDYYSGIVFEVFDHKKPSSGALVGGGRYDALTEAFGRKDIGATGAAGGVERIINSIQTNGLMPSFKEDLVYVACATTSLLSRVLKIVSTLRNQGISTEYDMFQRSLRKQLEDAAGKHAALSVILTENDLADGRFILRNMSSGQESFHKIENVIEVVKDNRNSRPGS